MRLPELDPEIEWVCMDKDTRWKGYSAFDNAPYAYEGKWYAEGAKFYSLAYLNIPKHPNWMKSLHKLNIHTNKWESYNG